MPSRNRLYSQIHSPWLGEKGQLYDGVNYIPLKKQKYLLKTYVQLYIQHHKADMEV